MSILCDISIQSHVLDRCLNGETDEKNVMLCWSRYEIVQNWRPMSHLVCRLACKDAYVQPLLSSCETESRW